MKYINEILSSYFKVDLRTLGIFRIVFGIVCFVDILRRIKYIETFYSDVGFTPLSLTSVSSFSLLAYFNVDTVLIVTLFFYVGLIFSLFFTIGYKTKFSQIVTVLAILSIHNRLIIVENGGDFVMNAFLIWSLFLPLGKRFSLDRLLFSLKHYKDITPRSLNSGLLIANNEPINYWGLAYFACILQLSIIYFFNYINKSIGTWEDGSSLYYFYKLDIFLTPIGNIIKEFSLMPMWLSKILTSITLQLEFIVPILLLIPIYTLWIRRFSMVAMIGFHVVIGITMYIGMFSWVMVAALLLLLSNKDLDFLKRFIRRFALGPYIVFYDSDCGFCHQSARIIRRMDLFQNLTWAGKDWTDEKPDKLPSLEDTTIVVWNKSTKQIYTRHEAFSKIISALPLGIFLSWILIIPFLSNVFGYIYDSISRRRTRISKFFGYAACDISKTHSDIDFKPIYNPHKYFRQITFTMESIKTIFLCLLIIGTINYAFAKCYQKTKNAEFKEVIKEYKFLTQFNSKSYAYQFIRKTRMIQNWNMFYSVPKSYKWMVVEATLNDKNETYDKTDTFIDKGNGKYDEGEKFIDEGNGRWDPGERFFDRKDIKVSSSDSVSKSVFSNNSNILDVIGGLKIGNGVYDEGEKFIDKGNGVYDEGEKFTDIGNGIYDEGEVYINKATTIDLLTGLAPNYLTLDYNVFKKIDNSQFWRKFLNRINPYNRNGDNYSKYRKQFIEVLSSNANPVIPFDDLNNDGVVDVNDDVLSVSLYSLNYTVKTNRVTKNDISKWIYKKRMRNKKINNLSKFKNKTK